MTTERRYREAEGRLFDDAGITPREHHVTLRTLGTQCRVLEVGSGRPVLFLPGGPNAAATWAYVAGRTRGVRWLLVDRPGTGLSEPPREVPTPATLPTFVEALVGDLLDGLGLDRAGIAGSSFGGYCALRGAAAHPDRVSAVLLAGCPAFVPGWTAPSFFTLLRTPLIGRLLLSLPVTDASARLGLRQMGHARSLAEGTISAPMLDWVRTWQRDTETMRHDAAMIVACGTRRDGFAPELDLTASTLGAVQALRIQIGTDDVVGGPEVAARLASLLPDASVETWEHAGHLPWLDRPLETAAGAELHFGASSAERRLRSPRA